MPPRRGIVKSGNAGNSSKQSKPAEPAAPEEKPLFPPGSKYPLSLLHERCQKNGWEKPIVDAVSRRQDNGFSFVVMLSRINKRTSQRESVRLEPHPLRVMPSALEARHWGATYALYRFCSGIQLNLVLPPGPREYWNELSIEHKNAPEHQKWMYEADPFAARKAVEERQTRAAEKRDASAKGTDAPSRNAQTSREFENAPEAKMASSLRELVEDSIKKAIALFPEAGDAEPSTVPSDAAAQLLQQLTSLGFKQAQARNAVAALSQPSALAQNLLRAQPPLQACIEFLILQIPECDLPPRFLPSMNTYNPFVMSAHAGTDDLKKRWMEERAVKDCGWPVRAVKECLTQGHLAESWPLLLAALNTKLVGDHWADVEQESVRTTGQIIDMDEDELEALGAYMSEQNELTIPLPIAPMKLVLPLPTDRKTIKRDIPPPMYILSTTVPAYVRLHIVSQLICSFKEGTLVDPGESFVMAAVRLVEEEWVRIEDHGTPDISIVLQHLTSSPVALHEESSPEAPQSSSNGHGRKRMTGVRRDDRTNARVKEEFLALCQSQKYTEMLESRKKLPASASENKFLKLLDKHRCVVVVGETGCGKTTQLPQFVLDSMILSGQGSEASIIVTQPRRLSAIGVAARVSAERLDDGSVGYAIRGESKQDKRTKLLFCTTGVVLRRLGAGERLAHVTHVIVDEVHERSVDGDFLLLELKELLRTHPKLKVVLMSATINHEVFVKYFDSAPLLSIPGFTHPVEDRYLEDILPLIDYRPATSNRFVKGRDAEEESKRLQEELNSRGLDDDSVKAIQKISRSDRIDFDLISAVVEHIVSTAQKRGAILIFLTGVQEIRQCMERLSNIPRAKIFPLHANLSSDEQRRVFSHTSEWKIIAATNVAETSITIDDVIYVIDAGKVKETHYDPEVGLTRLDEQWVTRAAAKQRRGRAGRTQPGVCYKLYTRRQESKMAPFPVPEIKRVPLESIALTVKVVHKDVKSFLSRALDPPEISAVDHALYVLEELSAINQDGELTPLGRHMAILPVDLRLGKMLILGTIFQCLGPMLTVAACLSSKPIFMSPMDKRDEATRARARFATGNSDLLTDAHAYDECMRLRSEGKSQGALRAFCEENFISPTTVRDITSLRQDFLASLSELGFVPSSSKPSDPELNVNSANENLLKAVILGGFWPRVARVHLPKSAIKFDRVQAGTIQRENTAKEYKLYDLKEGRVFLHPGSILFGESAWKSPFVTYFAKHATTKVFLRDATEVPIYGMLLFGGAVSVNHIGGGLTVGSKDAVVKLKAWPRIGVLVNQLRHLLDAQLKLCIEEGTILGVGQANPVMRAILALVEHDGLTQ
ncbi:hypothetical protein POSPLADRAFT_1128023 [Postia placenta MAD-698-R-SB12]|uniref:P-loop containing nucleoside triphosphate hydrolase protein n=1 Tax=Postia placenta MAD-698-R-SB12 TaxID=670580 RepID=A0A1X6NEX7_9APHY|nr:hypothetical protein POSPLADRAFT_1128023 [Postia placenta MAD-698-R-SB12]OSX67177.1 hypothetical protein POSPLADRAFT_1128023 [Postia placenta MAD-698-R-SB12]